MWCCSGRSVCHTGCDRTRVIQTHFRVCAMIVLSAAWSVKPVGDLLPHWVFVALLFNVRVLVYGLETQRK